MARTLTELLKLIAPEFDDADDAQVELQLELAALRVNRRIFGGKADYATALLAAHLLTNAKIIEDSFLNGDSRPIKSESIGDLSVTYEATSGPTVIAGEEELSTTTYGAQFIALRRGVISSPVII